MGILNIADILEEQRVNNIVKKGLGGNANHAKRNQYLKEQRFRAESSDVLVFCGVCLEVKDRSEFYTHRWLGVSDGKCKACLNQARRIYYSENSEFKRKEKERGRSNYYIKIKEKYERKPTGGNI